MVMYSLQNCSFFPSGVGLTIKVTALLLFPVALERKPSLAPEGETLRFDPDRTSGPESPWVEKTSTCDRILVRVVSGWMYRRLDCGLRGRVVSRGRGGALTVRDRFSYRVGDPPNCKLPIGGRFSLEVGMIRDRASFEIPARGDAPFAGG